MKIKSQSLAGNLATLAAFSMASHTALAQSAGSPPPSGSPIPWTSGPRPLDAQAERQRAYIRAAEAVMKPQELAASRPLAQPTEDKTPSRSTETRASTKPSCTDEFLNEAKWVLAASVLVVGADCTFLGCAITSAASADGGVTVGTIIAATFGPAAVAGVTACLKALATGGPTESLTQKEIPSRPPTSQGYNQRPANVL